MASVAVVTAVSKPKVTVAADADQRVEALLLREFSITWSETSITLT